jgi:hypothetical protein
MNQQLSSDSTTLWQSLVESHLAFRRAFREFFAEGVDRVEVMRTALRGRDRLTALEVAPYLKASERIRLFPEWVFLASFAHGAIQVPRDMILSLPREWVLANIEAEAEPLLQDGTYDEYRRLLELYELLDRDLTLKLARRAAAHADPDVREAGEEFLEHLLQPQKTADHS